MPPPLVSLAIQTHPNRSEMAQELLGCLSGRAELVVDPDPHGSPASPWRTYRLALERGLDAPAGTTHRLILQDDVMVCDYFVEGVEAAAASQPGEILVFFVAGTPPEHVRAFDTAYDRGLSWAVLDLARLWLPVVATAWPIDRIDPLLRWVDRQSWPAAFVADDEIAGRFLRDIQTRALAAVPSLVEHPDTVYSIASSGRRDRQGLDPGRVARRWIGDCGLCDARQIDWTLGP